MRAARADCSADLERLPPRVEGQQTVSQLSMVYGQVDYSLERRLVGSRFGFWSWNIGGSIGINHDVGLRAVQIQIVDSEDMLQARKEADHHFGAADAQVGRRSRRLVTMNHKIGNDGAKLRRIETKGADFDSAAGGILGGGDDFLFGEILEPVRPQHKRGSRYHNHNEHQQPDGDVSNDSSWPTHWKAS